MIVCKLEFAIGTHSVDKLKRSGSCWRFLWPLLRIPLVVQFFNRWWFRMLEAISLLIVNFLLAIRVGSCWWDLLGASRIWRSSRSHSFVASGWLGRFVCFSWGVGLRSFVFVKNLCDCLTSHVINRVSCRIVLISMFSDKVFDSSYPYSRILSWIDRLLLTNSHRLRLNILCLECSRILSTAWFRLQRWPNISRVGVVFVTHYLVVVSSNCIEMSRRVAATAQVVRVVRDTFGDVWIVINSLLHHCHSQIVILSSSLPSVVR